jgi:aspartate aminotransferase
LKPSPTLSITARANAMRAAGQDIISFAAGEPDFPTPETISESAIDALRAGFTKYTPSAGIKELREAISQKLAQENRVQAAPDAVIVSCGAKHAVYNSLMVLIEQGDEVLLIAPYWMTYAEQVRLAGGIPVVVKTASETGFQPEIEALRAKITPRTRAIVLNSPCNPTGAVFPRETIKAIAALALRHGLWIISDEIYEKLIYGVEHISPASLGKDVAAQTITVGGCSKSYAMTGWRIGYAAGPVEVIRAMSNLQDQVTSNPTSFAQVGAVKALSLSASEVEAMRSEFEARRDLIVRRLRESPGVVLAEPKGAFYVLPDLTPYLQGRITDDAALAEHLLDDAQVATVPGCVFEGHGHLRISYANSRECIERGVARIAESLQKLSA